MKRLLTALVAATIMIPAIAQRNQTIRQLCDMPETEVTFVSSEFSTPKSNARWRPYSKDGGTYIIEVPATNESKKKVNALLSDKRYKLVMKTKKGEKTTTQLVVQNSSDEIIESLMIEERPSRYEIIYEE